MLIRAGEKVHVIYRTLYDGGSRQHFLGQVVAAEGAVCRLEGYLFTYEPKTSLFQKRPEQRLTIIDLADSGFSVSLIDSSVDLAKVVYHYEEGVGMVATDGEGFKLNINEFGGRS